VAADDAAARQLEVDVAELLAVAELQRRAGLQWTPLSVRQRHEPGLRDGHGVAAGRQLREIEDPGVVRQCAAPAGDLRRVDEHARALDRLPGVGGNNPPGDPSGRRGLRRAGGPRGRIARGLLRPPPALAGSGDLSLGLRRQGGSEQDDEHRADRAGHDD
jgi:hypothetical protein